MDEAREKEIREMLSKMLDAPLKKRGQYDYGETERTCFSWDEIFFELGRLKKSEQKAIQEYILMGQLGAETIK